jgi:hypothetical protein
VIRFSQVVEGSVRGGGRTGNGHGTLSG